MTDADAEWLRERPEIAKELAYRLSEGDGSNAALLAILPLLRAAIRADVVRELAGDASDLPTLVHRLIPPAVLFGVPNEKELQKLWDKAVFALAEQRAAAHAQGRAASQYDQSL